MPAGQAVSSPTDTGGLLHQYLAGDVSAERRLFESFRTRLIERVRRHRLLRSLAVNVSAEDVVHEVFRRSLASGLLRDFEDRGRGSLERALSEVLESTLIDTARRIHSQKRGDGIRPLSLERPVDERATAYDLGLASREATPTSEARARELMELCRAELAEREWRVWLLAEVHGWTREAVAARLGITPSAARALLFRAKSKLVHALGPIFRPGP